MPKSFCQSKLSKDSLTLTSNFHQSHNLAKASLGRTHSHKKFYKKVALNCTRPKKPGDNVFRHGKISLAAEAGFSLTKPCGGDKHRILTSRNSSMSNESLEPQTGYLTMETIMLICTIVKFLNVNNLTSNGKVKILRQNLTSKSGAYKLTLLEKACFLN